MKIFVVVVDKRRSPEGIDLDVTMCDKYLMTFTSLPDAKDYIEGVARRSNRFREKSIGLSPKYSYPVMYYAEYVDVSNERNKDIYKIIEDTLDDVPDLKETEELKNSIKNLQAEIKDLKKKVSNGDKPVYREEPIKEKEAKRSNVKFW